jgi:hypothetical protein
MSSEFSAASFPGLTGHHTAPALAMPNAHANAIGSLPDSTATLSPGKIPDRARALPIIRDSRWTSA